MENSFVFFMMMLGAAFILLLAFGNSDPTACDVVAGYAVCP